MSWNSSLEEGLRQAQERMGSPQTVIEHCNETLFPGWSGDWETHQNTGHCWMARPDTLRGKSTPRLLGYCHQAARPCGKYKCHSQEAAFPNSPSFHTKATLPTLLFYQSSSSEAHCNPGVELPCQMEESPAFSMASPDRACETKGLAMLPASLGYLLPPAWLLPLSLGAADIHMEADRGPSDQNVSHLGHTQQGEELQSFSLLMGLLRPGTCEPVSSLPHLPSLSQAWKWMCHSLITALAQDTGPQEP